MFDDDDGAKDLIISIIGDSGVGKSSIINRYIHGSFVEGRIPSTIKSSDEIKIVEYNGKKYRLKIRDTAGQEKFQSIASSSIRGSHAIIYVCAINEESSLNNLDKWHNEIVSSVDPKANFVVVNKIDLLSQNNKSNASGEDQLAQPNAVELIWDNEIIQRANKWGQAHAAADFSVSAKDGTGIKELFDGIVEQLDKIVQFENHPQVVDIDGAAGNDSNNSSCC